MSQGGDEVAGWHLALDLGTKGLGAVLFNQLTGQSYALQWQALGWDEPPLDEPETVRWRLPAIAQIMAPSLPSSNREVTHAAPLASALAAPSLAAPSWAPSLPDDVELRLPIPGQPNTEGLLLCDPKAALDIGLPYYSQAEDSPEPRLNWFFRSPQSHRKLQQVPTVPLRVILRSLQELLTAIQPALASQRSTQNKTWRCHAQGLTSGQLERIVADLEGVVVNSPTRCTEAYRFNLREVILGAKLVQRPEQVAFLEEPIAALLAEFHSHRMLHPSPVQGVQSGLQAGEHHSVKTWQGATLVIHTSASSTELGLACLPQGLHNLSRDDLHLRSLAYGNQAYLQDIACQLLYPFIPEDQIDLDFAILPLPGEADLAVRSQLQRELYRSPTGSMLLEAAGHLNRALQKQERMTFELGPHRSSFSQTTLDTKVTQPFLLKLNREVNQLLGEAELELDSIAQVLCTGNGETLGAIQQWLGEKLPKAQVITDGADVAERSESGAVVSSAAGPNAGPNAVPNVGRPNYRSHRIAYGLATLPLYPQLLDRKGQQYSDYFLLVELLRCLPDEALTLEEILNHLEGRGINTQSCWEKVESMLAGKLPAGLVPQASDDVWILESRQNPDYQALEAPLFRAIAEGAYQVDPAQRQHFWQYWKQVMAHSHQTLEEPYILQVGMSLAENWA